MLECVPNVSEGRDVATLDLLADACGTSLLDVHCDTDHHRSVFTLAAIDDAGTEAGVRRLAELVAERVDLASHRGVHPRLGALDVVPFVPLSADSQAGAAEAAHEFANWLADTLAVPAFFYDDADPQRRSLPELRRTAFTARAPDVGPAAPHPRSGAVAVGARPVMVAVNCVLETDDRRVALAIAHRIRERDGGLPGVRALGFALPSAGRVQVSMNLVDLSRTGLQTACFAVRDQALSAGHDVVGVELVGLVTAEELARCDPDFLEWSGIGPEHTIEARLAAS